MAFQRRHISKEVFNMPKLGPITTNRQARARDLVACLRHMGTARQYIGATNNDCPTFNFGAAYNNRNLVQRRGKAVTESYISKLAGDELNKAKIFFRRACQYCEFREQCGKKEEKEAIFWSIYNDPKKRTRFYNRIKTVPFLQGEKTLLCTTGIRPGSLKKSDWVE